jgi:tetratricopeptide (TPR) repeat protein
MNKSFEFVLNKFIYFSPANLDYDQAIKKNPNFGDAYYNNGFLLYYLNLKQTACENFSKAGELGLPKAFLIIKKVAMETNCLHDNIYFCHLILKVSNKRKKQIIK